MISMPLHSFHLCIITNNSNLLLNTMKSVDNYLPHFRSKILVLNKKKKNIYQKNLNYFDKILKIKSERNNYWNTIIENLIKNKVFKVLFLFEGEIFTGNLNPYIWNVQNQNILFKIRRYTTQSNKYYINNDEQWELRVLQLTDKWKFDDDLSWSPKTSKGQVNISKFREDTMIVNHLNKNIINMEITLIMAIQNIKEGEYALAKDNFVKQIVETKSSFIKAKCYFGIGYCLSQYGVGYKNIKKLMILSFILSNKLYLEPIYFLVQKAIIDKKEREVCDILNNIPEVISLQNYPSSILLVYKKEIYDYQFLYIYANCLYKIGNYNTLIIVLNELLSRKNVDSLIKNETLELKETIIKKKSYIKYLENIMSKTNDIKLNIDIDINKLTKINIKLTNYENKELINNSGLDNLNYYGISFDLESKNVDLPSFEIKKVNNIIGTISFYHNNLCYLPNIPVVFHNLPYSIKVYDKYRNKTKLFGYINPPFKVDNKITLENIGIFNYKYIFFYSNGSLEDYYSIIFLFLHGCRVVYSGNREIYLDLKKKFGENIIFIGNWSEKYVLELSERLRDEKINYRKLINDAKQFSFLSLINNYYLKKPDLTKVFDVVISPNEITDIGYNKFIKKKKNSLDIILDTDSYNKNYIYLQNKSDLLPYYLWITTRILSLSFYNADILVLNIDKMQFDKMMIKTILESDIWFFRKVKKNIDNYDIIIFKNTDIIRTYLSNKKKGLENLYIVTIEN